MYITNYFFMKLFFGRLSQITFSIKRSGVDMPKKIIQSHDAGLNEDIVISYIP